MSTGVLAELGEWTTQVELADIPPEAARTAKLAILDCLGVTLAAASTPVARVVLRYIDSQPCEGGASVLGLGRRASPEVAAFANAAIGHALDFDDLNRTLQGH